MRKRTYITIIVASLMLPIIGILAWAFVDEAPLDYSAFDVQFGSSDPYVNGMALITEFTTQDRVDRSDIDLQYFDPETILTRAWTTDEIKALLTKHQDLRAIGDEAFQRPEFRLFQEMIAPVFSLDSFLGNYVKLAILESRLLRLQNQPDDAVDSLLDLYVRFQRYSTMDTSLTNELTANALNEILIHEFHDVLLNDSLNRSSLEKVLKQWPDNNASLSVFQRTLPNEFQEIIKELDGGENTNQRLLLIVDYPKSLEPIIEKQPRLVIKPHKTINHISCKYLEFISQETKPYSEQNYPYLDDLTEKANNPSWLTNNLVGDKVAAVLSDSYLRIAKRTRFCDVRSRMVRTLYAIRAYQLDHQALPPDLESLVPKYLPSPPQDPFDFQTLRYNPNKLIIYSVGEDGIDTGGSTHVSAFGYVEEAPDPEYNFNEPTYRIPDIWDVQKDGSREGSTDRAAIDTD